MKTPTNPFFALPLPLAPLALALALPATTAAQGLHIGPTEPPPHNQRPPTPRPHVRPIHPIRRPWRPSIHIASLAIRAEIVDGVATTKLTQVFHNSGTRAGEGTWILPLPAGATADHFTMTMNGKQVAGEVLDANKARSIYTSIVRRQRDPGLLEYMGNGCLRARVFPIPPKSDMKVVVQYRQVLPETAGVHQWSFPLRNAHVAGRPAKKLTLDLSIRSKRAIKNVYSPSPGVDVSRRGDHEARVSLELAGDRIAARDLDVYYGISDKEFGLDVLTHRKQGEPGYFVLMLAPKIRWDESKAMPKCINFVVDTSGSMAGKKIEQARGALAFFVNSLKPADHFNVITFSTEARPVFGSPMPATGENRKKALDTAKDIEARGGTNIEDALGTALGQPMPEIANLVGITVFLTDGMPTVDTTDTQALLKLVAKKNTAKHRIFVFGVGHDVNTRLLDKIAQQSHGDRDYVREHEDIELKTGALFTKLSHPVMSHVAIDCEGIEGFDMFPKSTPDLFRGSRLLVTGRYKGTGHHAIRLNGVVEGVQKTFVYEGAFPATASGNDFIPTLWAQRKVAVLLDAIRLNGRKPELVAEVRRLGSEHGIVTPYTSNLVLEDGADRTVADGFRRLRRRGGRGRNGQPQTGGAPGGAGPSSPGAAAAPKRADLERVAEELRRAGAVEGKDAEKKVEAELAKRKPKADRGARRPRDSAGGGLGRGGVAGKKAAVDYSLAVRKLAKSRSVGAGRLVRRRIAGHSFLLIDGVWIDKKLTAATAGKVKRIEAFSDDYFALLDRHEELAKILAFSTRIVIVLGEGAVEIFDSK